LYPLAVLPLVLSQALDQSARDVAPELVAL